MVRRDLKSRHESHERILEDDGYYGDKGSDAADEDQRTLIDHERDHDEREDDVEHDLEDLYDALDRELLGDLAGAGGDPCHTASRRFHRGVRRELCGNGSQRTQGFP